MQPLVECSDDIMTLTVSGHGFTHLQVDRKSSSPISIFQLPSSCGYSVKASWRNLEMMVPYDGCYIHQENGSYVLPLLWLGSPVKLSCPRKMSTVSPMFSLAAPSVFCSSYGMAVQIHRQEQDLPVLGVIMNGARSPFVSEMCAFQVDSQPQEFTFLISHNAPCIIADDGLQLQLILDDYQFVLSCPVLSQFPSSSPLPELQLLPRGDLPSSYSPDATRPKPTSTFFAPSRTTHQKPTTHHQTYYTSLQYHPPVPVPPQVYPPAPQSPQPRVDNFPGSQMFEKYPSGFGKLTHSFGGHLRYPVSHYRFPVKEYSPQVFKSPDRPAKYAYNLYYPFLPFSYISSTSPAEESPKPSAGGSYPKYYLQTPYHPATTAAPVTRAPATVSPPFFPPKRPEGYPHQTNLQSPPLSSYYGRPDFHPAPQPYAPLLLSSTDQPKYLSRQLYLQSPFYFQLPTHVPPTTEKPQKPAAPQGYYSYHYQPNHHTPRLSLPLYPKLQPRFFMPLDPKSQLPKTKTPYTTSIFPDFPTLQTPHLQCLKDKMAVFLPFANPESLQVRDHRKTWQFVSSVFPLCGYMLQRIADHGLIFHSPLPACHSSLQNPTTISLPIKYWDSSVWQNRTLDLLCPYQSSPETQRNLKTPAPVDPPKPPTPR
uniref:ZP domain-containing protein n=2 Tax=Kryptolebias marmoratus TaxID=37003 RepID=A0A3Q3BI63_KRYMA